MILLRLLLAGLWKPVALLLAALGLYGNGRADARRQTALEAEQAYAKTRKDMDDADATGDDPAVLRDWLRARDPGQR